MKKLSLSKSTKILFHIHSRYKRKKPLLPKGIQEECETLLLSLQTAIQKKEKAKASALAHELESLAEKEFPKSSLEKTLYFIGSLAIALVLAILVRQMWFEFYTIPSGSMRPTLKETDYLVVSKTPYGLNTPGRLSHFFFDEKKVQRGDIVIFSAAELDIQDPDTMYFYILPGKKQFIKRLIGKPGDTVYFYGGQIYGVDKNGKEFSSNPWINSIEHIPFLRFEGKVHATPGSQLLYHFNEPLAQLHISNMGLMEGELFPLSTTLIQDPQKVSSYSQLFGLGNYATTRILTEEEYKTFSDDTPLAQTPYYLEFRHHPDITQAHLIQDMGLHPSLGYSYSYLPLDEEHLQKIFSHVTTARFVVKNEHATKLGLRENSASPTLKNVPDGTYEWIDGTAYLVSVVGTIHALPPNHPLYQVEKSLIFNLGIEWDSHYLPSKKETLFIPSRYAYFRNGDLYVAAHPIFSKTDTILQKYLASEKTKNFPFMDALPPSKDMIEKLGIRVPENMYLVLGDNHAMSSDSRIFGFVPEKNLRGKASFIFWPVGSRFGFLNEPSSPFWSPANLLAWGIFLSSCLGYFYYQRKKLYRPLKF